MRHAIPQSNGRADSRFCRILRAEPSRCRRIDRIPANTIIISNIASELKIIPHIKICKIGEKAIQGGVPFCFPPCAAGRLFCLVLLLFDTRAAGSAAVEIYAVFVEYAPY